MHARRRRSIVAAVAVTMVMMLAACGAPARVRTLDGEPDLVRITGGTIPSGFTSSVHKELLRLRAACVAVDPKVGDLLPDIGADGGTSHVALNDDECQWTTVGGTPELVVGILADPDGNPVLDQTSTVITAERSVDAVGDRAVFDAQTRTLYVVKNGRLWYLQLVGQGNGVDAPTVLSTLGRALVQTPAATA